jgi:hypothetical protein
MAPCQRETQEGARSEARRRIADEIAEETNDRMAAATATFAFTRGV